MKWGTLDWGEVRDERQKKDAWKRVWQGKREKKKRGQWGREWDGVEEMVRKHMSMQEFVMWVRVWRATQVQPQTRNSDRLTACDQSFVQDLHPRETYYNMTKRPGERGGNSNRIFSLFRFGFPVWFCLSLWNPTSWTKKNLRTAWHRSRRRQQVAGMLWEGGQENWSKPNLRNWPGVYAVLTPSSEKVCGGKKASWIQSYRKHTA